MKITRILSFLTAGIVALAITGCEKSNVSPKAADPESVIDLIQICLSRNPDTGLVVVTHSFEKATAAAAQMEAKQLENEFLQITSCRAVSGKDGHEIAPGETAFIVSRIES